MEVLFDLLEEGHFQPRVCKAIENAFGGPVAARTASLKTIVLKTLVFSVNSSKSTVKFSVDDIAKLNLN